MASIVLSFVGSQDPYSDKNKQEGSIVTLIRNLLEQKQTIKKILLLYTTGTQTQAELTREWLNLEVNIELEKIQIFASSQEFSDDLIDLSLAFSEAYSYLSRAIEYRDKNDMIEFNATSGTPAMKMAWAILPALGYASKSRLWQVRNPSEMKPNQQRVFSNTVNVFKNESDLKLIKKQLQNYNYVGALQTLENSDFEDNISKSLLKYSNARLNFNFDEAFKSINNLPEKYQSNWLTEINKLRQKQPTAILHEIYYKGEIKLNQEQYADFLILVFSFQENLLRYLVKKMLLSSSQVNKNWKDLEKNKIITNAVKNFDNSKLLNYLKNYRLDNGNNLKIDFDKYLNRTILKATIEYKKSEFSILSYINYLETYCDKRNDYIHNLEGVSEISEASIILENLQKILQEITQFSKTNPFKLLNEQIVTQLTQALRGQN